MSLNKVLDKLGNEKNNLHTMLTAFVSLINMKSNVTITEVREDVKSHSHLLEKLINGIAANFEAVEEIVERQRETLKDIQKAFTDSTQADNKFCQPYAAILAWAQNFPFFLRHNQQLQKVTADLGKAQKELDQKGEKMQNLKNVLDTIAKDALVETLVKEI